MKGELDKMSEIVTGNNVRELKQGYFLCEVSSATTSPPTFCLKQKQLCDTSTGKARCICKEGWKGYRCEELISEPPATLPTRMPTLVQFSGVCTDSSQCTTENTECIVGKCACKSGFTSRKGYCLNVNECGDHATNQCHRNAQCIDNYGGYECNCNDGFTDMNPSLPGKNCEQSNECKLGTHNCSGETHVCVDRRPPEKWECVEKTPSPTPKPSPQPTPPPTVIPTVNCGSISSPVLKTIKDDECTCEAVNGKVETICRPGRSVTNTIYIVKREICTSASFAGICVTIVVQ
jgi:Calcium-binding EGF domain/EB module